MALTRIVCPHCEMSMEVPMTSVTRSRECPHCGKIVILQTAARDSKQPHKALLMPVTTLPGNEPPADVADLTPKALTGDPRQRMEHDPEVRRTALLFKWGSAVFGGLLVVVLLADRLKLWSSISSAAVHVSHVFQGPRETDAGNQQALSTGPSEPATKPDAKPIAESKDEALSIPDALSRPQLTDQQQALMGALAFLNAATVEERLTRIRDRQLNEKRIRSYYEHQGDGPVAHERVEPLEVNPAGPFTYSFNVVMPDGARRKIMMGKARHGEYMADWGSFVLYSEMSWNEFRAQQPKSPTLFRVLADREELFGREFADPQAFVCLRLLNPLESGAKPLYGYAPRNSELGRTLKFVMEKEQAEPVPLMLKLSYPENSANDYQVWITEFIGEGWMARNW